ncbi:MAG: PHP domain-containing protein [Verrucomicrobia bacterium]|nr:PHP domain-containing protein [Verrucomicrobiota bacterium]
MFKADLHCHSTSSDGSLTPEELIIKAQKMGLQGLSITDHDTVGAYETAIPAAKANNIRLGSGIELSCDFQRLHIHILGYDFDVNSPKIHQVCELHRQRRLHRNREILIKLEKRGMKIAEEDLVQKTKGKTAGRPHIAALLVEGGYVKSIRQAFDQWIGDGKPCYAPGAEFPIEEGIDAIHAAGGKAFLAHPHLAEMVYPKPIPWEAILSLPFDGIECYYGNFPAKSAKRWLDIAEKKHWLVSGGSDFHGVAKPDIELGTTVVDEGIFNSIFEHPLA